MITLADGRLLDVRVSGPDNGPILLFHHGTPGASTPVRALERAAHGQGLRYVSYSRPGYGSSMRRAGRSIADVVEDVGAVLDSLGDPPCVTAGWSGGGPHALATAALLPERVSGALVIAGVAPFDVPDLDFLAGMGEQNIDEFGLAVKGEAWLRPYLETEAVGLRASDGAGLVDGLASLLPAVDRAVLTDEFGQDLAGSFAEGLCAGVDGWLDDDLAFCQPWGFDLSAIRVPVQLWHGDADLMVPFAHGQWLAQRIPRVQAQLLPGEGHLSIAVGRAAELIATLAATI